LKKSKFLGISIFVLLIVAFFFVLLVAIFNISDQMSRETIRIISSTDNQDLEDIITDYAEKNKINVEIDYAGTLEIMDKLNSGEEYDAVLASNSMWLYMLDGVSTSDSKIISMNPVVFGIKKSKAEELGFVGNDVKLEDILNAIKDGKLKFAMTSATQTNTGACAYLGFLSVLSGNPEILTEEYLEDETIKENLKALFNGVNRSSGSEEFLEEMYMDGECDAIVTYETSIININQEIENDEDTIYAIYTQDGVSISDSVFAFLGETNTSKEEAFLNLQSYLLSNEGQEELIKTGRRVWYGGIKEDVDKSVFNPDWGIDTTKYITPIKFPSTQVIKKSLALYQSELRKPTHIVFALDYSGSMTGEGITQLREAMKYILTEEEAEKNYLQFSSKDKISFIMFNSDVSETITIDNGLDTEEIIETINTKVPRGGTNIYDTVSQAIEELDDEDTNEYNVSIVLMTDGEGNDGSYNTMVRTIDSAKNKIPVYSIMFGNASSRQLQDIAELTSGKVFDGRTNLLEAFKTVRGYN
jgi:Ca-activated chloride channel family protein